jgi:PAS domain S-box-containing protein
MAQFFRHLLSTDFMPHSVCLRLPDLIALHAVSDSLIALSYFLIPVSIIQIVRRRRDLAFPWMFLLFGLFILSCGTTHLLSVWTLWHPVYRFDGLVKALTAASSLLTAILLIRLSPHVVSLPSAADLRATNDRLQDEIMGHRQAEQEVRELNARLKQSVAERDTAIATLNDYLRKQGTALLHSERDVQFIMDLLPALVAYIDKDGFYRRVNRVYQDWFGLSPQDIQGRHISELLGPEYLERIQPYLASVLSCKAVSFDAEVTYPIGARTVNVTYTPDCDSDGFVRGFAALTADITDRKLAELQLQRQADLLDQAMEPLLVWELRGSIEYWNRAAEDLYGYSASEAVGRISHELLQTSHPLTLPEFEAVLERDGHWTGELTHTTRSGRQIVVESHHRLMVEPNGRKLILESNRDVTERKQNEAALRRLNESLESRVQERTRQLTEANQELEAFSYSVSHDLRAPLRSVDGFGRMLFRDYPGRVLDQRGIHYIERMSAATVRMGQLIEDLLNLSQISRTTLRRDKIDLSSIASEVINDLSSSGRRQAESVGIQRNVQAFADPRLMRILLQNLLGNAWKFTGKTSAPEIEFGCSQSGKESVYFVRDTGVGFDMAHVDQLFAPFHRLHSVKEFEGTGIGLAIVQRIVHRHGGRVWAEGKLGSGATFFFTLGSTDNGDQ